MKAGPILIGLLFLFLGMPLMGWSQIFSYEQNPPHLRWRQIQGAQFRLIYPEKFETKAHEMAWQIDSLYALVNADLQSRLRKTAIILQNQSVMPNGFVQLAPRRSEFVTTPPAQGENDDWLRSLAIHELRHVAQFDRLVGNFRAPFFEQLGLAFYGLSLPPWYFEGDAVVAETRLTNGGRGRTPSWIMPFRTNVLMGRKFSYQKDYLGSFKDVTPGFYELGYLMVDKLERDFGEEISAAILSGMSRNLLRPYNFSRTLKKLTGHTSKQWHAATIAELASEWAQKDAVNNPGSSPGSSPSSRSDSGRAKKSTGFPEDWLLPQAGGMHGEVLALHQGNRMAPEIVQLDEGGNYQKTLIRMGWQTSPNFSAQGGKIVWDEIRRNPRFTKQLFSIINTYDQNTGQIRHLTRNTRLFTPAISPDGRQIACVEVDEANQVSLLVLDWENGEPVQRIVLPDGIMIQTPSFHDSGQKIACIAVSRHGTSIVELDLRTADHRLLFDWQQQQLERPVYWGDDLIFKAHFDGLDNIYSLSMNDRLVVRQLTFARFGAFNPAVAENTGELLFNDYQLGGQRISKISLSDPGEHEQEGALGKTCFLAGSKGMGSESAGPEAGTGAGSPSMEQDPNRTASYSSKPFYDGLNLFNFHSVSISSDEFSDVDDLQPSLYWLSDNLLNTVQTRLGYTYDGDLRSHAYSASFTYQRYFPKFALGYENRGRSGAVRVINQADSTSTDHKLSWRENHLTLDMRIPLTFYRLNHIYSLQLVAGTYLTQRYGLETEPASQTASRSLIQSIRFPMRYGMSFGHNLRRSQLDLAPRWGQNFGLSYRHFQSEAVNKAEASQLFTFWSTFYLPGIARNHSTVIRFNYQQGAGIYAPVNDIPMVSGFDQLSAGKVNNTLLTSYHLPLAYPDWAIGNLAYIKRIKGGLFADFQNVRPTNPGNLQPRTFGVELRTDLHLLRYYLPLFDIGAKLIYDNDPVHRGRVLTTFSFGYSY